MFRPAQSISFAVISFILSACLVQAIEPISTKIQTFDSLVEQGGRAFNQGDLVQAHRLFTLALTESETIEGHGKQTGDCLHWLAITALKRGDNSEAERHYKQALECFKIHPGVNKCDYLRISSQMGKFYFDSGKYSKAEAMYRLALVEREMEPMGDKAALGRSFSSLATVLFAQGKIEEAKSLLVRALKNLDRNPASESKSSIAKAMLLNDTGSIHFYLGEFEKAKELFAEAVECSSRATGSDKEFHAQCLGNLGWNYHQQGDNLSARDYMIRALVIQKESDGLKHLPAIITKLHLAYIYLTLGRIEEASKLANEASEVAKEVLGVNHPDFGTALFVLGTVEGYRGRYEEAEHLFKRALAIFDKTLGPSDLRIAESSVELARIYLDQKRYVMSEPLLLRSIKIHEATHGLKHPEALNAMKLYADLLSL